MTVKVTRILCLTHSYDHFSRRREGVLGQMDTASFRGVKQSQLESGLQVKCATEILSSWGPVVRLQAHHDQLRFQTWGVRWQGQKQLI